VIWIDTVATPSSRDRMERVRSVFAEARGALESRLHHHREVKGI
jgi:hypothetical protein